MPLLKTWGSILLLAGWLALNLSGQFQRAGFTCVERPRESVSGEFALAVPSAGVATPLQQIRPAVPRVGHAKGTGFDSTVSGWLAVREPHGRGAVWQPVMAPEELRQSWPFIRRTAAQPRAPDRL